MACIIAPEIWRTCAADWWGWCYRPMKFIKSKVLRFAWFIISFLAAVVRHRSSWKFVRSLYPGHFRASNFLIWRVAPANLLTTLLQSISVDSSQRCWFANFVLAFLQHTQPITTWIYFIIILFSFQSHPSILCRVFPYYVYCYTGVSQWFF